MKNYIYLSLLLTLLTPIPSSADVFVEGYYRSDGTYVAPHYKPDPGITVDKTKSTSPDNTQVRLKALKDAQEALKKDNEVLQRSTEAQLLRNKLDVISNQLRQLNQGSSRSGDLCLSTLNYHLAPLPCYDETGCRYRDEYYARARAEYDQCKADEYNRQSEELKKKRELERQLQDLEVSLQRAQKELEKAKQIPIINPESDESKYGRYADLVPKEQPKIKAKAPISSPIIEKEVPIVFHNPVISTSTVKTAIQATSTKQEKKMPFNWRNWLWWR